MNETNRQAFNKLLLSELCLIPVTVTDAPPSDAVLVRAVTANEELLRLGMCLSPADVVLLSHCAELEQFPAYVRSCMENVQAEPMYPDFPKQVMEMSAAVFRFHQMMHYLSTYGMEELTGEPALRGWMPDVSKTPKTKAPKLLLSAKTVQLIRTDDVCETVLRRILSKTERMTGKEQMLIAMCLPELTAEQIAAVPVPFKENLALLFVTLMRSETRSAEERRACLHQICQHTGDVWKCFDFLLHMRRFRLHTAEKRMIVKLLERYPAGDFRTNLMLSNLHRERILLMLQYLDYNTYSRSAEHKEAVRLLRAGKLHSWQSDAMCRIRTPAPDALEFIAKRPGMMLRMLTLLLRNGYSAAEIAAHLTPHAAELRTQTLVTMLNHFDRDVDDAFVDISPESEADYRNLISLGGSIDLPPRYFGRTRSLRSVEQFDEAMLELREKAEKLARQKAEYPAVTEICRTVLEGRLRAADTPVKGKKLAFRFGCFAPDYSIIRTNDKSDEGGYIPSGVAYRIPADADHIRFFVYWNDTRRVDVDLHTLIVKTDGVKVQGGWNTDFSADCMAFSGDITHSNAAEYIDIDLSKGVVDRAAASIHVYSVDGEKGRKSFDNIQTCYVGCMAVGEIGEKVKLYSPANCFFTHSLKSKCETMIYGYVDAVRRCVVFLGEPVQSWSWYSDTLPPRTNFNLLKYLEILVKAQGVQVVSEDDAEYILVMGKPASERELSLRDWNYFMDEK